MLELSNGAI